MQNNKSAINNFQTFHTDDVSYVPFNWKITNLLKGNEVNTPDK